MMDTIIFGLTRHNEMFVAKTHRDVLHVLKSGRDDLAVEPRNDNITWQATIITEEEGLIIRSICQWYASPWPTKIPEFVEFGGRRFQPRASVNGIISDPLVFARAAPLFRQADKILKINEENPQSFLARRGIISHGSMPLPKAPIAK